MKHSPDAYIAFVQAATLGSFSAAARKLGKSQSTISAAIANLETDLGLALFDRSHREPRLTEAGAAMLGRAQELLAAADRLELAAGQLAAGLEPRLTLVISDTYQSDRYETTLIALEQRYPELEFECLIAEHGDVLALIESGRAQLGLVAAQPGYAADIGFATIPELSEIGLFVARGHPLTQVPALGCEQLQQTRELRLETYLLPEQRRVGGRAWSASSYLLLLEMAGLGLGWAELPRWLVKRFAADSLQELSVPGWPKHIAVDAVWSRQRGLGPAGAWLLDALIR